MVLVGRSGCGKTTLLHVIAGISRPDSGTVRIDDGSPCCPRPSATASARADRLRLSTFNLLRGFTALENVLLAMRFTGRKPDRPGEATCSTALAWTIASPHRPAKLSVGEQQRVAVAGRWPTSRSSCWPTSRRRTSTPGISSRCSICCGKTCGEENVALVLVTHSPEVAGQFGRVEHLEEFNQVGGEMKG